MIHEDEPKPAKQKTGRTPVPEEHLRKHGIRVRFSITELEALNSQASRAGIPLATFIRQVAMGERKLSTHKIRPA